MRKPRSDSKLKTLPVEVQEEIILYASSHSLAEVKAWLEGRGVKTSSSAISYFWDWWQSMSLERRASRVYSIKAGIVTVFRPCKMDIEDVDRLARELRHGADSPVVD
jgi:hypothetical protein